MTGPGDTPDRAGPPGSSQPSSSQPDSSERVPGTERARPRRFIADGEQFGRNPDASWLPLHPDDDIAEVIAAYWQHLAVCVLRAQHGEHAPNVLAAALGKDRTKYLDRKFLGTYRVSVEELITWAVATGDVTLLPPQPDSIDDLYPPGTQPRN